MGRFTFEQENDGGAALDARTMLILAIATSIDALAVGVTFAFAGRIILYSARSALAVRPLSVLPSE